MALRKYGHEKFPDGLETALEIAGMEETISDRISGSVASIIEPEDGRYE